MSVPSPHRPTALSAPEALIVMMKIAVMGEVIAVEIGSMEVMTMKESP